jgi:two-component system, OmpR family, sensor kinase
VTVRLSLRARLLITSAVLVAAGLLVADVVTYRFLSSFLFKRVDEQLTAAIEPAAKQFTLQGPFNHGGPEASSLPFGTYAELVDPSGNRQGDPLIFGGYDSGTGEITLVLPAGLPGCEGSKAAVAEATTFNAKADDGSSYRVRAISLGPGNGTFVVAIPLADVHSTLGRLVGVEAIVSAIVLLGVVGVAFWLVRLGLRPLQGIGETAGAIAAGDLTRRVEPAESRTEVGRLGLALNAMLAQIESAFEERRVSERRLRRFVADASHELRTPLTSIRGYAELFRRGADTRPEDLSKTMRRIEEEAARMGVLVDDLLLLARLDQGRPLDREEVDVAGVATDAVDAARVVDPDRPIELRVAGPAVVSGDPGRLRQVIDNLLSNVRVHTPAGSSAEVEVRTEGDHVVLAVTDHGPGLPDEVAGRAFERFYRGDPARSRETGGAGLGLSIVSAIVEAHGGSVSVRSVEVGGARFEVRLPIPGPVVASTNGGPGES